MKPIAVYPLTGKMPLCAAVARAEALLRDEPDTLYEIVIRKHKSTRSIEQNSTLWMWATELQDTDVNELAGHDKQWWYDEFKLKFEIPILERDEGLNFDMDRAIYAEQTNPDRKEHMRKLLADSLHVSDMGVEQTSEAMEAFMQYAVNHGVLLTIPEERI